MIITTPGFYASKAGKCEVVAIRNGVAIGWIGDGNCSGVWACKDGDSGDFDDHITGPWIEPRKPVEAWAVVFEDDDLLLEYSKEDAEECLKDWEDKTARLVHLREVEE